MNFLRRLALHDKKNLMTAGVSMLLKSRASPEMLPFSLSNKKRLAIRHMNKTLFPKTLSIPSYDIGNYVGLRAYQHPFVRPLRDFGLTPPLFTSLFSWNVVRRRLAFRCRRFGPTMSVPSTKLKIIAYIQASFRHSFFLIHLPTRYFVTVVR